MASPTNSKVNLAAFQQLPPLMKQVINNPALIDNTIAVCDQYALTPKQQDMLMSIERDVVIQHMTVAAVPEAIKKIGMAKADPQLTLDFLGRIILPMEWFVGNVQTLIKSLGGNAEQYLAAIRLQFPEVYNPTATATQVSGQSKVSEDTNEPVILRDIGEHLATAKGRAGVLLHLVRLSQQVEDAGKSGKVSQKETEELLHGLDALSYAINTQDLNPLEIAAIKRRLKTIMAKIGE